MHREKRVANYIFLLYVCASVVILSASFSDSVIAFRTSIEYLWNPVPSFGSHTVTRLADVPPSVAHLLSADSENRSLREDLKQLSWAQSQILALRRENERLRT